MTRVLIVDDDAPVRRALTRSVDEGAPAIAHLRARVAAQALRSRAA